MKRKIIKIILLILWMGLIFFFSMDSGVQSKEKSNGLIIWIGEKVFQRNFTEEEITLYTEKYSFIVRKTAHFTLYFILGFLFIIVLEEYHPLTKKDIFLTIFFAFLYSFSDEIHQLFSEERSCQLTDVLLDTTGSIISSTGYYFFKKRKNKNI